LSVEILFKLPLRQTAGMVASLLRLAGLDWPVPDFSTLGYVPMNVEIGSGQRCRAHGWARLK
jgi:hypothetical protein